MPDGGIWTARAEVATSGWRRLPLIFWTILAIGVALRVAAFNPYAAHHPDESIQYLEQAHRIVFGYGVVPWEFRYFIRRWLIPLALAAPIQLGEWISPGGIAYLVLPRALVLLWGAGSLVLVNSEAFRFGWRKSEPWRLAALAGRDPRVCGIAGNSYHNVEYGYAFVHRPVPVYLLLPDEQPSMAHPGAAANAFNAIIANTAFGEPEGFPDKVDCGGSGIWRVCLYTRPGGCTPNAGSAPLEHQAFLLRQDI